MPKMLSDSSSAVTAADLARASSLFELVAEHAAVGPDKIALICAEGSQRSYGDLVWRAAAFGGALVSRGLRRGDRVAIWMPNRVEWVESLLACSAVGLVAVPLNPDWGDDEIGYVFEHCSPAAVVVEAGLAERAGILCPGAFVVVAGNDRVHGHRAVDFDDLIREHKAAVAPGAARDPALIIYTSGTTSPHPKGVIHSQRVLAEAIGLGYARTMATGPDDRCLIVTPLFHCNALGGCLSALVVGGSVVFPRRFSRSRFWDIVDRHRPTYLFTLAPIVNIVLAGQHRPRRSSLRAAFVLGVAQERARIGQMLGGITIVDAYGLSECPTGTYIRADERTPTGSAGRPFPGIDIQIQRADGSTCMPGEVGEIVFGTRNIFSGYFGVADADARPLRAGWFQTGDLGTLDDDGYLFFADRLKDIIRRGGENISSLEVEAVLRTHPAVADVAVVAAPDPLLGERVVAVAVPVAGHDVTLAELRGFAADRLSAYKLPEELQIREELPRTPSGKVQKFRLRSQAPANPD